jgi:hypothetical protein
MAALTRICIGEEIVPQVIGVQTLVKIILIGPDNVPPRLAEFVIIHLHHPTGHNCIGYTITRSMEERRPEDAVVVYDIASDKVRDSVLTTPILLPVIACFMCPLFCESNVADGSVHPDIDDEIVSARELHTPVECAGDTPVMEFLPDPAYRIILCIRGSFQCLKVP